MGASSVTGKGVGDSAKVTSKELSILANGPTIIFTGIVEGIENISSPPSPSANLVKFPYPLPGGADNYVVLLTTVSGGQVYVADRIEDGDDNFTGFGFICEAEGPVMYLVAKVGTRPNI